MIDDYKSDALFLELEKYCVEELDNISGGLPETSTWGEINTEFDTAIRHSKGTNCDLTPDAHLFAEAIHFESGSGGDGVIGIQYNPYNNVQIFGTNQTILNANGTIIKTNGDASNIVSIGDKGLNIDSGINCDVKGGVNYFVSRK